MNSGTSGLQTSCTALFKRTGFFEDPLYKPAFGLALFLPLNLSTSRLFTSLSLTSLSLTSLSLDDAPERW